jgi:6-pyruvoyltetrahydropterin/6-carboxytetrahydropterin synthase
MDEATLERSANFSARHHYWHPEWTEERNRAVFGALAEPHEHEYRVTVWVRGPMDPVTGFCVDLPALESALAVILGPLRGADLNVAIESFRDGRRLPSCENLARWVHAELSRRLGPESSARVVRVRVAEDADLAAEYHGG